MEARFPLPRVHVKSIDPSEWGVVTQPQTHREAAIHMTHS
jgi:hypothetical protein